MEIVDCLISSRRIFFYWVLVVDVGCSELKRAKFVESLMIGIQSRILCLKEQMSVSIRFDR